MLSTFYCTQQERHFRFWPHCGNTWLLHSA
jgi:hypothetical protein